MRVPPADVSSTTVPGNELALIRDGAGFDFHPTIRFDVDEALTKAVTTLFIQEMSKRGCIGYASLYLNAAHTDEDFARTTAVAGEALGIIKAGLDRGDVAGMLECELRADIFRRLVRWAAHALWSERRQPIP